VQRLLVHTPAGPVTIFNVHFLRSVLRRGGHWQRTHGKITDLVSNDIAEISGPVIMGGDFNITEQTETFRQICMYMKNAHSQAGRGFGFTFPSSSRKLKGMLALPPMIRIDHLFYNDSLLAYNAATLSDSGQSDHLPIVAEFILHPSKD
jgi:vancomycin resistance protein VanJ